MAGGDDVAVASGQVNEPKAVLKQKWNPEVLLRLSKEAQGLRRTDK